MSDLKNLTLDKLKERLSSSKEYQKKMERDLKDESKSEKAKSNIKSRLSGEKQRQRWIKHYIDIGGTPEPKRQ